jgi:DNA-directed RNA polymerase specialized sigma subunit
MLTPDQQKLVEEAAQWVPACVKAFLKNMPCLRPVATMCDLDGAAYLACCSAARTYNPEKGSVSAYFSVAIKNAMLQEIQREIATGSTSVYRISPKAAEKRMPVPKSPEPSAIGPLLELTEEERGWIERHVFDGHSFRSLGRQEGCDPRTAKRRLIASLDKLRQVFDDSP